MMIKEITGTIKLNINEVNQTYLKKVDRNDSNGTSSWNQELPQKTVIMIIPKLDRTDIIVIYITFDTTKMLKGY